MSFASGERFQAAHEKLKAVEAEFQKLAQERENFIAQHNENRSVKVELDKLTEGNKVYKRVGTVVVPVEQEEANSTVTKRIEFIEGKLEALQTSITDVEGRIKSQREAVLAARQEFDKEKAQRQARQA